MAGAPGRLLLALDRVEAAYGAIRVLFGLSLTVCEGEVVALLGRNGAGKTTTLRAILGLATVTHGRVAFAGADLQDEPIDRRARRGIGYVPQDRRIFAGLSVRENLEVGHRSGGDARHQWSVERVLGIFPGLRDLLRADGGRLSGGEQQMLAIARALMGNPRLLLLDEPSEGLAPVVVQALIGQVVQLKETGVSVLMSEQNLRFTKRVSDRVYVLEGGHIRFEGSLSDPSALESASKYVTI